MVDEYIDVELNKDQGYYDISFENGDFKKIKGMDTAIWLSIFTDARASESQVTSPEDRRGSINDLNNPVEMGSLNWLYEQARLIRATVNGLMDTTKTCLSWLVDYGYAKNIETTAIREVNKLEVGVKIETPDGDLEPLRTVTIWNNTPSND